MLSWKKHCWCKNHISVWSLFFINFAQVTIKMTKSEKVTREILHFSLRVFCQLFWAALMAESSQNCSLNGTRPIPAMLTHQHFDKVKCPSTAGHYPSSVFSPNVIERHREVTSYRGFHVDCTAEQPETLLIPMQTQSLGQLGLSYSRGICWRMRLAPCCHTGMLLLSKGSMKQNCPNFGSSQHFGLTSVNTEAVWQRRAEFNNPLRNHEQHYVSC